MGISFFTKSADSERSGDELSLVIDIESGIVRGSLVVFSRLFSSAAVAGPGVPPRILHTISFEIAPHADRAAEKTGSRLLQTMLETVSRVADTVVNEGLRIASANSVTIPISKIHVVFSSPWIIPKTKTVKISYEKDTEITKAAVNSVLGDERRELEQRFLAEHDDSLEFDLAFVEQKIFEVKLNGYPTAHFEQKQARELEVSFALSISSKGILAHIEKALDRAVKTPRRNIEYHSSLLLQYSALRNIVSGSSDYIALHVHEEISDIIIVKEGVCAALASFPSGTEALSRESGNILKQSREVAGSSLNLQARKFLHPAEDSRVVMAADSSVSAWAAQFMKTLETLGMPNSAPHRVYLLANRHYSHFERALVSVSPSRPFGVIPIDKDILDLAVSHQDKEQEDTLMSLYVFALR